MKTFFKTVDFSYLRSDNNRLQQNRIDCKQISHESKLVDCQKIVAMHIGLGRQIAPQSIVGMTAIFACEIAY